MVDMFGSASSVGVGERYFCVGFVGDAVASGVEWQRNSPAQLDDARQDASDDSNKYHGPISVALLWGEAEVHRESLLSAHM